MVPVRSQILKKTMICILKEVYLEVYLFIYLEVNFFFFFLGKKTLNIIPGTLKSTKRVIMINWSAHL